MMMMMEDGAPSSPSTFGSGSSGERESKRPQLDLGATMTDSNSGGVHPMTKEAMKVLLHTNVQSVYGMARLAGISKEEFLNLVCKACD